MKNSRWVVDWKSRGTWFTPLSEMLSAHVSQSDLDEILTKSPIELCSDDSEWLSVLEDALIQPLEGVIPRIAEQLRDSHFRAYHGCRTDNVADYLEHGLLANDPAHRRNAALHFIDQTPSLEWMRSNIDERIAATVLGRDAGQVYVGLDDRVQLNEAGAYLIYGSEWLACLVGPAGWDELRKFGIPTVFSVNIPARWLSEKELHEAVSALLQEWTCTRVNNLGFIRELDFTPFIQRSIPPEFVVGHYHPERVFDPLDGMDFRDGWPTVCPSCKT